MKKKKYEKPKSVKITFNYQEVVASSPEIETQVHDDDDDPWLPEDETDWEDWDDLLGVPLDGEVDDDR